MPLPQTRKELHEAGYRFLETGTCRGHNCRAAIEYWQTPRGRQAPYDPMPEDDSPAISHFATCVNAPSFRRGAK